MSKSPDEIFNEAMQKEAYERFDENPFVAFERCADWLKENPHLIPSVKGLVEAVQKYDEYFKAVERGEYKRHVNTFELICAQNLREALKAFGDLG